MKPFAERLETEAAAWVREGLISTEQRARLLERYRAAEHGAGGRFVAIVSMIGGALLLVGIALIVKANWQAIGDWVKIGGLVALLLAAYAAGWRLRCAPGRYPRAGDACLMLGAALFVAGIALVSQVFHLNARPATAAFVWWLGIVGVPWLTGAKGAQFVSLFALFTWLVLEMRTPGSWLWVGEGRLTYESFVLEQAALLAVGGALAGAGLALRGTRAEAFAGMMEKWGLFVACATLYFLGFVRHRGYWGRVVYSGAPAVRVLAPLVFILGLLAGVRRAPRESLALAPWLLLGAVPAEAVLAGWSVVDDRAWLWLSVAAWAALVGLNLAMVRVGLLTGRAGWVNLAIGFVALNLITRYFDLVGTMLQGGLSFITSGVVILGLGLYLERKRRALLGGMVRREAV